MLEARETAEPAETQRCLRGSGPTALEGVASGEGELQRTVGGAAWLAAVAMMAYAGW